MIITWFLVLSLIVYFIVKNINRDNSAKLIEKSNVNLIQKDYAADKEVILSERTTQKNVNLNAARNQDGMVLEHK